MPDANRDATVADLQRAGSALLLETRCPSEVLDPATGETRDDGPVKTTTMRVPLSVLREWLKGDA